MKRYVRFVGKEPSILKFDDDPDIGPGGILEEVARLFRPREVDQGLLSLWSIESDLQSRHVDAAYAARRKRKDRLCEIRIPAELFEIAGIAVEDDPDEETFACVSNLHKSANTALESSRRSIAEAILGAIDDRKLQFDDLYRQQNKANVKKLVENVQQECIKAGQTPNLSKTGRWAREEFEIHGQIQSTES